nr:zinc finger, CCHC-type [Tanacetum cinerariifolium]
MGCRTLWRNWIRACLDSGFSSVLVNGSPTPEFKLSKGLRQGDQLSHVLFIIAIEALHIAMLEAREKHIFQGIKLGESDVTVSHLQFANDAIFLGEWSKPNVLNLIRILRCFQVASGLKVNLSKSRLIGVGPREEEAPSGGWFSSLELELEATFKSGRETTEFGQLTELVHDVKLSNLPDSWRWSLEKSEPKEKTQGDNRKDKTTITFLYQAIPEDQLLQITKHKTAKAIWDALKTRHIGEERVQQARLQTLKSDFEMLHMKEDETIDTFTAKLTTLVNKAASLGHTMKDGTLVQKLLNAIPDRYLQIVASIEQYSDVSEMTLKEAIG